MVGRFEQNWPAFYKTSGPHYWFQQIRDMFFILFDVLNIFFYKYICLVPGPRGTLVFLNMDDFYIGQQPASETPDLKIFKIS